MVALLVCVYVYEEVKMATESPLGANGGIRCDCKTAIIYESNVIRWIKVQSIKVKIKTEWRIE